MLKNQKIDKVIKDNIIFLILEKFCYFLILLIFISIFSTQYIITPDSSSYIKGDIIRSPLYPFIISIIKIFSPENYLNIVPILQIILFFSCFIIFTETLSKIFNIKGKVKFFIIILILIFINLFDYINFYNIAILTESITYSLFLLLISFIMKYYFNKEGNKLFLLYAFIITTLLIITRKQLYFIYPFWILFALLMFFKKKSSKEPINIILGIILSLSAGQLIERFYVYNKSGKFDQIPLSGVQLITSSMIISNANDINNINGKYEKQIFVELYAILDESGILINRPSEEELNKILSKSILSINQRKEIASRIKYVVDNYYKDGLYVKNYNIYEQKTIFPPFLNNEISFIPKALVNWKEVNFNERYKWQEKLSVSDIYDRSYVPIIAYSVFEVLDSLNYISCGTQMPNCNNSQDWINIDNYTKSLALDLVFANPIKHIKFYINNIFSYYGFLFTFFIITLCILSFFMGCISNNAIWIFLLITSSFIFSNIVIVGVLQSIINRYLIYTDILFITSTILIIKYFISVLYSKTLKILSRGFRF